MIRRAQQSKRWRDLQKKAPKGIHFLRARDDLTRLMSAESLRRDGRGGTIEKAPVRFGPPKEKA